MADEFDNLISEMEGDRQRRGGGGGGEISFGDAMDELINEMEHNSMQEQVGGGGYSDDFIPENPEESKKTQEYARETEYLFARYLLAFFSFINTHSKEQERLWVKFFLQRVVQSYL